MRSGGGAMTVELAAEAPLTTVLSGPAGGIAGAAWLSREVGLERRLLQHIQQIALLHLRPFGEQPLLHECGDASGRRTYFPRRRRR